MNIDTSLVASGTSLRAAQPQDETFLFQVYASTRDSEMALVPWGQEQKEAFLRMQFQAQSTHYKNYFPAARHWVIELDGSAAGRLIIDEGPDEILLIDIALLPEHRQKGTGTALLRSLLDNARQSARPVRLHVEAFNPAHRLYQRLGFIPGEQNGLYLEMNWKGW